MEQQIHVGFGFLFFTVAILVSLLIGLLPLLGIVSKTAAGIMIATWHAIVLLSFCGIIFWSLCRISRRRRQKQDAHNRPPD